MPHRLRHLIHKLIAWYLRRVGGACHVYPYGPQGRYIVLMTDREYHDYTTLAQGLSEQESYERVWALRRQGVFVP